MKPILIDGTYINTGGGYILLRYLVEYLSSHNTSFSLIKDKRCPKLSGEEAACELYIVKAGELIRKTIYKQCYGKLNSVLCFGNVPPPIKLSCPVYTYFQNVNMLDIPKSYGLVSWLGIWLKRTYISFKAVNTDGWIVQTRHTENILRKFLPTNGKSIHLLPFYRIPTEMDMAKDFVLDREDYLLIGNYYCGTKGHDVLVNTWERLSKKGLNKCLHITVSNDNVEFCAKIEALRNEGVNIINHGTVPFEEVIELYKKCKATIYPSKNESLGLGIVEALHAGCDVIASDLPYVHCICQPSEVFNPDDVDSLCNAILRYENKECQKSELLISNNIDKLIELLQKN